MKYLFLLTFLLISVSIVGQSPKELSPERFAGEWNVYIVNNGEKNLLADYRCRIQTDGEIKRIVSDSNRVLHWGRIMFQGESLTLLLSEQKVKNKEGKQEEKRGIVGRVAGNDVIEFRNAFQPELVLHFERRRNDDALTSEWIVGTWTLVQMNLKTQEKRIAPYRLVFSKDGRCSFTGKDVEQLNADCAGSYKMEKGVLLIENSCKEKDSLWFQPVFFRDGDQLTLNRLDVFIRAERLGDQSQEQ